MTDSRHPLFGAHQRLARAHEHIASVEGLQEDARCEFQHWVDAGEHDPDDPFIEPWAQPLSFSIVLGEATHDLRSALDYLAYELVEIADTKDKVAARNRQFPICTESRQFAGAAKRAGLAKYQDRLHGFQPFSDPLGNAWLLCLQVMWNRDKHRMLDVHFARPDNGLVEVIGSLRDDSGAVLLDREPLLPLMRDMASGVLTILRAFEQDFASDRTAWYATQPPRF